MYVSNNCMCSYAYVRGYVRIAICVIFLTAGCQLST